MPLIDARGNLFGHLNVVDVAVVAGLVALASAGTLAYSAWRVRPPEIAAVTPTTMRMNTPAVVRLTGRNFRPYLNAYVVRTGEPLPSGRSVPFLIGTPTTVELRLPALGPGTYDIHLRDGADDVARRESAFKVARPGEGPGEGR